MPRLLCRALVFINRGLAGLKAIGNREVDDIHHDYQRLMQTLKHELSKSGISTAHPETTLTIPVLVLTSTTALWNCAW